MRSSQLGVWQRFGTKWAIWHPLEKWDPWGPYSKDVAYDIICRRSLAAICRIRAWMDD
jgi:hypothetical protein